MEDDEFEPAAQIVGTDLTSVLSLITMSVTVACNTSEKERSLHVKN
jgi:hypothetical protein